uniref:CCHC-type domain-containing protein n=1 Tax=Ananas comosus var. bracteatus TaxID=296719 RepID=A0A6V7PTH8_ANACO|nr:unnamed protein product [Ananas comosus var. bracteatus]
MLGAEKKTLGGEVTCINAKKKKTVKRLAWADEVGRNLLEVCREVEVEKGKLPAFSKSPARGKLSGFNEDRNDEKSRKKRLHAKSSEVGSRGGELWRPSSCKEDDETRFARADEVGRDLFAVCRDHEVEKGKLPASSKSSVRGKRSDLKEDQIDEIFMKKRLHTKSLEVGEDSRSGELRRPSSCIEDEERRFHATGKGSTHERCGIHAVRHQWSKTRGLTQEPRGEVMTRGEVDPSKCSPLIRGSYKEALLRKPTAQPKAISSHHPHTRPPPPRTYRDRSTRRSQKRCFRCLATDHAVVECRDPVRCLRCWRTGHRATTCRETVGLRKAAINRAANLRARAPPHKVFVPYTEEYLRRIELRRNATLADVIEPANLGPEPITVIKTALASRFGGYTEDFAVARCRERNYAIFLPNWVPADVLIRREILTLNGFWLRCWPWGRYRDARPHRVQYKAWIRLINLPFEIWSVARVAALVSSFGRFIKADSVSRAMTDLRAFRCQIALDSIYNIPQNLSVIIGEELFPVMVYLERWERADAGGVDAPPAPPTPPRNGDGNPGERPANRNHERQADGNQASEDEAMEDAPGELEEAETNHSNHRALRSGLLTSASSRAQPMAAGRRAAGSAGAPAIRRAPRLRGAEGGRLGLLGAAAGRWGWAATGRSRSKTEAEGGLAPRTACSATPEVCSEMVRGQSGGRMLRLSPPCHFSANSLPRAAVSPTRDPRVAISPKKANYSCSLVVGPETINVTGQTSGPKLPMLSSGSGPTFPTLFSLRAMGRLSFAMGGLSFALVIGPQLEPRARPTSPFPGLLLRGGFFALRALDRIALVVGALRFSLSDRQQCFSKESDERSTMPSPLLWS